MTIVISFDFETKDPYIDRKIGLGWVYKYHNYVGCDFKVLGCAYADENGSQYLTDMNELRKVIMRADIIVAHNLQYDLGCLAAAGLEDICDMYYGKSVCTMIAAILVDNSMMLHSLDACAKRWLNERKASMEMYQEVWDLHIFPLTKIEEKSGREKEIPKTKLSLVKNWTMKNLDIIQEHSFSIVAKYATVDAIVCRKLYFALVDAGKRYYEDPVSMFTHWAKLVHVTQDYTKRGVRVDMRKLEKAEEWIQPRLVAATSQMYKYAGREFNPNSPADMTKVFIDLGLRVGKTKTGNPSVTKDILEVEQHPLADAILEVKELKKLKSDFIKKLRLIQEYTMHDGEDFDREFGRVHPIYKVLGAKKTGRFSSTGPNFQQIPKNNKKIGPWCRGTFVPEEGDSWISLDYSNQEGRLQVHFAYVTKCTGAADIRNKFVEDKDYDMHTDVANAAGIKRPQAKAVNHGLTYGMGQAKLCKELKLPTKSIKKWGKVVQVAGDEAAEVLRKYDLIVPYVKELDRKAKHSYTKLEYIRTIGGRILKRETAHFEGKMISWDYKALNKLIQGSAACQTGQAMIDAYEAGLPVICTVHDELNLTGKKEDGERLKHIMEHAVETEVPMVADLGIGSTWWDAG